MGFRRSWKEPLKLGGSSCVEAMVVCLTMVFGGGVVGRWSVSLISLFWMTPGLFGSVDGPGMNELLSGFSGECLCGLVKDDSMSVLMSHMCCL